MDKQQPKIFCCLGTANGLSPSATQVEALNQKHKEWKGMDFVSAALLTQVYQIYTPCIWQFTNKNHKVYRKIDTFLKQS